MPTADTNPIPKPTPAPQHPNVAQQDCDKHEQAMAVAVKASSLLPDSAPDISSLACHLADVQRAISAYDGVHFPQQGPLAVTARWAREILEERAEGLRTVIGTLPATCMTDAAVQIALIGELAQHISSLDGPGSEAVGSVIERLAYSALPIVGKASGAGDSEMGWDDLDRLRVGRFAGVGVQS